jgi:hypothetical protein
MTDSNETIRARSLRISAAYHKLETEEASLDDVIRMLDEEERNASLAVDKKITFDGFRELARKIAKVVAELKNEGEKANEAKR